MKPPKEYTREELIQICEDSVVSCEKWQDRDSASAQKNIQSLYAGLTGGVPYSYNIENDSIYIVFEKPTKEQIENMQYFCVDSWDDWREWYIKENGEEESLPEMFEGNGIDWYSNGYLGGYLPTEERLDKTKGEDWY